MKHVVAVLLFLLGCREEPTIVIRFDPTDQAQPARSDGAAVAAVAKPAAPDLGAKAAPADPCKVAADCVVEPDDCCDCSAGGKQIAVSKKHAMADKAARKKRCADVMCTASMSTDPSCAEIAGCVAGHCAMVAKKEAPAKKAQPKK